MIAVLTFLCLPTSLGISPRCSPPLVDLSRVKKLNWCEFVVNQLKAAAKKLNKNNSFKGCILLLVVSLLAHQMFILFLFLFFKINDCAFFSKLSMLILQLFQMSKSLPPCQGSLHGQRIYWMRSSSWTQMVMVHLASSRYQSKPSLIIF